MPPGKKTKNTLAYVFTVANVLGTCQRLYHCPLLIYRCHSCVCVCERERERERQRDRDRERDRERHTNKQTDRQTDEHTDRQTDAQTDRHTGRQTDRQRVRVFSVSDVIQPASIATEE